jgi:hypothetical protein
MNDNKFDIISNYVMAIIFFERLKNTLTYDKTHFYL